MRKVFHAGAPPLAPFLFKRRRKRYEIRARSGRNLREHSCERRGVTKVATPWMLLFFVSAGSQGGKPCPRHLCSEAESVIVGYTHSAGMLCNRLRPVNTTLSPVLNASAVTSKNAFTARGILFAHSCLLCVLFYKFCFCHSDSPFYILS